MSRLKSGTTQQTKIHAKISDESKSQLEKYQDIVVGNRSKSYLVKYEVLTFFLSGMRGLLGLGLRQKLYPALFKDCGKKVVFGADTTLRSASKISIGDNVVISDGTIVDGRSDDNTSISIGDRSIIGQRALILCKGGQISIGENVGIGAYCGLYAVRTNQLKIGDDCMIGPYTYFGGTRYYFENRALPIYQQGHDLRGGIAVGNDCWFGAGVSIMDGVKIGCGVVVGSGAVVTADLPDYAIAAGVPAKVIRYRGDK